MLFVFYNMAQSVMSFLTSNLSYLDRNILGNKKNKLKYAYTCPMRRQHSIINNEHHKNQIKIIKIIIIIIS